MSEPTDRPTPVQELARQMYEAERRLFASHGHVWMPWHELAGFQKAQFLRLADCALAYLQMVPTIAVDIPVPVPVPEPAPVAPPARPGLLARLMGTWPYA